MQIRITHVDRGRNCQYAEYVETIDAETAGEAFRVLMGDFGRCESKVYVDKADGSVSAVGWVFVKRMPYDDSPREFFTRETWASPVEVVPETVANIGLAALS